MSKKKKADEPEASVDDGRPMQAPAGALEEQIPGRRARVAQLLPRPATDAELAPNPDDSPAQAALRKIARDAHAKGVRVRFSPILAEDPENKRREKLRADFAATLELSPEERRAKWERDNPKALAREQKMAAELLESYKQRDLEEQDKAAAQADEAKRFAEVPGALGKILEQPEVAAAIDQARKLGGVVAQVPGLKGKF